MIIIYNSHATIDSITTLNAWQASGFRGIESSAAGTITMTYPSAVNHSDAGDVVVATVDSSGSDDADRANRVAAMDAIISKQNTVNKDGYVVAYSEIENVKPGGITGIAVTTDS